MTRRKLEDLTVDELVRSFVDIAHEQRKAELHGDLRKMRALFWRMHAVENELRARPGDQRSALIPLLSHGDRQVMLKAALATLALEPRRARAALEALSLSGIQPQALEAGTSVWAIDEGIFKPT